MNNMPASLLVPDEWLQKWYYSSEIWKLTLMGAAADLIDWFAKHPPEKSIDLETGSFSDYVRNPILDEMNINMASHGHYNAIVTPKLTMLKEFTRLHRMGHRIAVDLSDVIPIVTLALTQADNWNKETKKLERQVRGPDWGKAFDSFSWCEFIAI